MIVDDVVYCNVCSAEIPANEPNHEFSTDLLEQAGHCHAECLVTRNHVVGEFDATMSRLGSMLDPGVPNHPKIMQASAVEAARGVLLRRTVTRAT